MVRLSASLEIWGAIIHKRYWLFGGGNYYPCGGMEDFIESFDELNDAIYYMNGWLKKDYSCWCHIYDIEENSIVEHGRS